MGVQLIGQGDRDNNVPSRHPILRKTKSAVQAAVANATATNVVLETTQENYGFTVVSTTLFTPQQPGLYRLYMQIAWAVHATANQRRIVVLYNNTDAVNMGGPNASVGNLTGAGQATNVEAVGLYQLLTTKQYAMRGRQDSGAALDITVDTWFQVEYVGPIL